MRTVRRSVLIGLAANVLIWACAITMLFWWPLWRHHHPILPGFTQDIVEAHRTSPADGALQAVTHASMLTDHPPEGDAAVRIAERLLAGELAWPGFPPVRMGPNFSPADLERGPPVIQLFAASMVVPEIHLRAFEHTADRRYLVAASRYLEDFVRYEASVQFPTGFLHNAHAVANRATALARYWRAVRADPVAFPDAGSLVHEHASRLAALLMDAAHFIGGTNHGVMQNVALLQLSTAFPRFEGAAAWRRLALDRFEQQRAFWLGPEGMVLEHSAGYHFHGVVLLGHMLGLLQAAGQPAPSNLKASYDAALKILAAMQRPDGSLPVYGNTYRYQWRLPRSLGVDAALWNAHLANRLTFDAIWPTAGAQVWWFKPTSGAVGTQTFVSWGRFPQHGHRRAQDTALLLWADGQSWITSSGYWPGDDPDGGERVAGWAGSNALHLVDEPAESERQTSVLGHGVGPRVRFVDLERRAAGGAILRRQVIQLDGGRWIVVDSYADPAGRPARLLWTAEPELALSTLGADSYRLVSPNTGRTLRIDVAGGSDVTLARIKGSKDPFGGWVAFDRKAWPAPALDVRLPRPGTWVVTRFSLQAGGERVEGLPRVEFRASDDWTITMDDKPVSEALARRGNTLRWTSTSGGDLVIDMALAPVEAQPQARVAIDRAREQIAELYPRFRTLEAQRQKASVALGLLALFLCVIVSAVAKLWPRATTPAFVAVNAAWLAASASLLMMLRG